VEAGVTNFMTTEAVALQSLQQGPLAYHCPQEHGPLQVCTDERAQTGFGLVCHTCGHRIGVDTALLGTALAQAPMSVLGHPEPPAVQLRDGSRPRGLLADGTIRTTGWLQVGTRPVSSGLWAAFTGFWFGLLLVPVFGGAPLFTPLVGYLLWKWHTTKWRPASKAVNTGRVTASGVETGQLIRLYGSAGPVGKVAAIGADAEGRVRLRITGGQEFLRVPLDQVCVVELRN
jgi:hypothetical protein